MGRCGVCAVRVVYLLCLWCLSCDCVCNLFCDCVGLFSDCLVVMWDVWNCVGTMSGLYVIM